MRGVRRLFGIGMAIGAMVIVAGVGVRWYIGSLVNAAVVEIKLGRFGAALVRLKGIESWWPGRSDVAFRIGECERSLGRAEPALDAWRKVRPDSSEGGRAAVGAADILVGLSRFDEAESILTEALKRRPPEAVEIRRGLIRLFRFEGRDDEAKALVEANLRKTSDPYQDAREHASFDLLDYPVDGVRSVLERAAKFAPRDDRVWLGRANLAIATGRHPEAEAWIAACLKHRPDDPAVWRSRLGLAIASRRPDLADQALRHIDLKSFTSARALSLRAWFAENEGDLQGERAALEQLVAIEPANPAALERLAVTASDPDGSKPYRDRKLEADRALDRYRRILREPDFREHVIELAGLAERASRWREALAWWTIVASRDPANGEAKLAASRIDAALASVKKVRPEIVLAGRPIPASRPDPGANAFGNHRYDDDALSAGIVFSQQSGNTDARELPQTVSGGVALLDYDGDGWLDVYAVQGGPFPPEPAGSSSADRLYRNRRDGTFEDVSVRTGLASMKSGYGYGAAAGDYDGDGKTDVFVTRWGGYALYRNRGDGTFEDVTTRAGLGGSRDTPTSAAWFDIDGDGDLDLYVCHYVIWESSSATGGDAAPRDHNTSPLASKAAHDRLYRNDGGRFVDVTAQAGIVDDDGRGLGVVAADFDDDGRDDLFVANDMTANYLFHNLGGGRFEEVGVMSGVAGNANGGYQASMGVALGDLDGDGRIDLAVTNYYSESTTFYQSIGAGLFADRTSAVGLLLPTRFVLGFGIAFFDSNNDGILDLAQANGHVNDLRPNYPFAMRVQLFEGGSAGRLTNISDRSGAPWQVERVGRGLATGDLDNDGRLDLLIVSQDSPLAFLHNRTAGGHFVTFGLSGSPSNRDAIGAKVTIVAGGRTQIGRRYGGGSFLSTSDPRLHFGLGAAMTIDSVSIRWPSGREDVHRNLKADAAYLLREGSSSVTPLTGFAEPGSAAGRRGIE